MQKELTNFQNAQIQREIKRMATVVNLSFCGRSDEYKGFYMLLTARAFINRFFDECDNENDFSQMRICLHRLLSEFMQELFTKNYEGKKNERH